MKWRLVGMQSRVFMDSIVALKDVREGPVRVRGWVASVQTFKRHFFIILRDGVGEQSRIQVFTPKKILMADPVIESFLEIEGIVKPLPATAYSFRPFELEAQKVIILGQSDSEFMARCPPDAGVDIKLTERHLYLRDSQFALITKLRAILLRALRDHFDATGCTEVTPPSFVSTLSETGASLFHLKHPGAQGHDEMDCYLTQSYQEYLEYCLPSLGSVFCIHPSFRAEKSHTRRHLTEFTHVEAEWVGIMTLEEFMEKLRGLLKGSISRFLEY